jgi:hypothetical protein
MAIGILSLDTIIIPWHTPTGMKQHALTTAITLYRGGTLDVETAAQKAGVTPRRLRRAVERLGDPISSPTPERERLPVGAD